MAFLQLLQGLRNPFLDGFFSLVTMLGEETAFIVIGILFFWCLDKKQGYYLLSIGLSGTVINQFLKLIFRIPRPWVLDPDFTIVDSAREAATGYSFPSGHTQAGVGIFGGIARRYKKPWIRIICIAICVLIPFSRMWLGVHTPLDVAASVIIALVLIFGIYPIIQKGTKLGMRLMYCAMILLTLGCIAFVHLYQFPSDVDAENLLNGTETAYKMLGCIIGMWLAYEVDVNYSHFETKAPWWGQILKLVLGLIPVVLIKTFLKQPLYMLIDNTFIADCIRYFLLTAFAGCVWPLTFRLFKPKEKK